MAALGVVTGVGRAFLRAVSVTLCCEPSLAELGNLGTLGNLTALFVLVLENGKGREKCSSLSWTKMTQKLRSQQVPTLFWVFGVFFVLNFSSAVYLRSIQL